MAVLVLISGIQDAMAAWRLYNIPERATSLKEKDQRLQSGGR
ncbi:MAG: hypothetical protein RLO18_05125 [Gimesia chilikensis]